MNAPTRTSLQVLRDVIFALYLRELKTRFGTYRLGLAWAFLEPMAFILILTTVRSFRGAGDLFTIPMPLFFMLGYVPFQLFSALMKKGASAVWANRALFNYRQLRPIDALIARTLVETLVWGGVLAVLMLLFWWWGYPVQVADPLLMIASIGALILLGSGVGLALCVAQVRANELKKIVPIVTRPLFFVSGLFFSLNEVPSHLHHYLLWNPILHALELIRHAAYPGYAADSVSLVFVAICALVSFSFGLAVYRLDWRRMVAS